MSNTKTDGGTRSWGRYGLAFFAMTVIAVLGMAMSGMLVNGAPVERPQVTGPAKRVLTLMHQPLNGRLAALRKIDAEWNDEYIPLLIEIFRFSRDPGTLTKVAGVLENHTGQKFGTNKDAWRRWQWKREPPATKDYASFKSELYRPVDPRFSEYFDADYEATIRLDEICWGGVKRDGIPPLKNPEVISPEQATYLADADVVFGVSFDGQARAYPKRILAWHEMVKDSVGDKSINGVYCTLCGSMIVYDTEFEGNHFELGTSGFLYRSNKLMYDHVTKSMWSTLRGEPVVGPLVGKGIKLKPLHVVTTTWGEWKQRHPKTDVLSLKTGHRRDYGEGVAYRKYFATDKLMFIVPNTDDRLKNKDEVLIVRQPSNVPVAIAADFLNSHRIYRADVGESKVVVVTDESGANRVYEAASDKLTEWVDESTLASADGTQWKLTEASLTPIGSSEHKPLIRLPAHRAFWFGWYAAFPDTKLIQ